METVQQNGRFTLYSRKFPSNIYSILFGYLSLFTNKLNIMFFFQFLKKKLSLPQTQICIIPLSLQPDGLNL